MKITLVRYLFVLWLVSIALFVTACVDSEPFVTPQSSYPNSLPSYPDSDCSPGATVILHGVISIVRNGATHYFLQTDNGQKWTLIFQPSALEAFGGGLAIDRQRVTIQGQCNPQDSLVVIVTSLKLDSP